MPDPRRSRRFALTTARINPDLIEQAKLGLMLPGDAPVSRVLRAALELAAGVRVPDGRVDAGGWRPRR
jgi:hypothetical protein